MAKPIKVMITREIPHPLDRVWQVVALEFGQVAQYSPEVNHSRWESASRAGIGAKRHCDFASKGYVKEEIIGWNDRQSFRFRFTESSVPMAFFECAFTFTEKEGHTQLTQEIWYRMKPPFGWLSGLAKGKMKATLEKSMDGLITFLNQ